MSPHGKYRNYSDEELLREYYAGTRDEDIIAALALRVIVLKRELHNRAVDERGEEEE